MTPISNSHNRIFHDYATVRLIAIGKKGRTSENAQFLFSSSAEQVNKFVFSKYTTMMTSRIVTWFSRGGKIGFCLSTLFGFERNCL